MSESQTTDISKKQAYELLDSFVEQLKEYVLYEDMHIYDQEVELNTDNYGSELTVSLEGEKIGIDYIDFEMYVREALPEYFKEDSSEEE
tara:strand:+ start:7095 stop:7361 length:267 start_codon:yes stop_codon:yes gene_type:complete